MPLKLLPFSLGFGTLWNHGLGLGTLRIHEASLAGHFFAVFGPALGVLKEGVELVFGGLG